MSSLSTHSKAVQKSTYNTLNQCNQPQLPVQETWTSIDIEDNHFLIQQEMICGASAGQKFKNL